MVSPNIPDTQNMEECLSTYQQHRNDKNDKNFHDFRVIKSIDGF